MKSLFTFVCGFMLGLGIVFLLSFERGSKVLAHGQGTPVEGALAQLTYQKLGRFSGEIDLDRVLALVKQYAWQKPKLQSEEEIYRPILEWEEKKAEAEAIAALKRSEAYLARVGREKGVQEIVSDRVYMQVLQPGEGEQVKENDVIQMQYKEYSIEGKLFKDALKPYFIPLSQTIKGFQLGLKGAKVGERRKLYIHPEYGFGTMGRKKPNKVLIYEVEVLSILPGLPLS